MLVATILKGKVSSADTNYRHSVVAERLSIGHLVRHDISTMILWNMFLADEISHWLLGVGTIASSVLGDRLVASNYLGHSGAQQLDLPLVEAVYLLEQLHMWQSWVEIEHKPRP